LQFLNNGVKELLTGGKQRRTLQARGVLCYWGTRELANGEIGDGPSQPFIIKFNSL
jgi:hypothetical protein